MLIPNDFGRSLVLAGKWGSVLCVPSRHMFNHLKYSKIQLVHYTDFVASLLSRLQHQEQILSL